METSFMVCARVDELDDPVEGSTKTACVECGSDLWISPESRRVMHEKKAMPCCAGCGARLASEYPSEIHQVTTLDGGGFSPGQLRELEQTLRKRQQQQKFAQDVGLTPAEARHIAQRMYEEGIREDTDAFESMRITSKLAAEKMTEPDQEWGTVAIMEDFDGQLTPFPLQSMLDALPKEFVAKTLLPAIAATAQARRCLLGIEAWAIKTEGPLEFDGPIHDHPDRFEMLLLLDVRAEGIVQSCRAEILRDGINPPTLSEWEFQEGGGFEGMFVEALVPTLQMIKEMRERMTSER